MLDRIAEQETKVYVLMGVSGCGKSTIGKLLSEKLDVPFYEGDDFHPESNILKMAGGTPLDDSDRIPWLNCLATLISDSLNNRGAVIACSALKEKYRKVLCAKHEKEVRFIHLKGCKDTIMERVRARTGHYMPLSLLDSQFGVLEEPRDALDVPIEGKSGEVLEFILSHISV